MSGAEDTSLSAAHWVAAGDAHAAAAPGSPPRRRLFRKYALLVIALVGTALLVNSGFDFWFSYQENKAGLIRIQQEKAEAAARRIEEAIGEYQRQIGWTTHAQWAAGPIDQRRQDYFRLLRQVPAITELTQLDAQGREELTVSRLKMDVIPAPGTGEDFSKSPAFVEAKAHRIWFSPVYFRKESEPYMTMGIAREGKVAGVTVAEINLKLIWDVITALKIGQSGYAYVVDERGRLIAHPDISLVLRDTDLSKLPQVEEALAGPGSHGDTPAATVAQSLGGRRVLTAHAVIAPVGWRVFVEVPLAEAFAPLYGAALRTLVLLILGLIAATLVALVLARRMTGPIRAIEAGAARIGAGEFDRRIEIHTGDELEALAGQFNRMGEDLQKSYAELEQRVADRTAELSESLDQQTATAEVLGVINSSPGDLAPVFDAMLEKATRLCEASFGIMNTYDGDQFHAVALHGVPAALAELWVSEPPKPGPLSALSRIIRGEDVVHIPDMATSDAYQAGDLRRRAIVEVGGARSYVAVSLRKDGRLLGTIAAYRQEIRPFSDKEIALLQNFAAQAVIAMENARLITETQEALDQQTATAEVLQVINSSPGDLAPVFDAMLEKATELCDAPIGTLWLFDGEHINPVAIHGAPEELADFLNRGPHRPNPVQQRQLRGEGTTHLADLKVTALYRDGDPLARAVADLGGIQTVLSVPLRREDRVLGLFGVYRQEIRPFSDKQIALIDNFAAQAVIAMENARLITETREALEQQTATAEVLGVINSSPGDLAPVFDAMLEKALRLCEAGFGIMNTFDGERFSHAASHGMPADLIDALAAAPPHTAPHSGLGRVARGENVVRIEDMSADQEALSVDPRRRAFTEVGGARSYAIIALRKDGKLLGTIAAYRQEVRPFSDKQIALLQNFAAQAVIAMENARLITETREALEQQTATAEVLGVINSSPGDLAPVFDAMLERAMSLCEAAHGHLYTYDGERFEPAAIRGEPSMVDLMRERGAVRPRPDGIAPLARVVRGEAIVHVADALSDEYRSVPEFRTQAEVGRFRTVVTVALRKEDRLLGVITVYRQEVRPFSDKQVALLQNFAAQAVIAMENARLITETREALEQQTATAEVLEVINASPGDLVPVFDSILEKAHRLCGAEFGSLNIYDGEENRAVATRGLAQGFADRLRQGFRPGAAHPIRELLSGVRVVQVPDAAQLADPIARASYELAGMRTVLFVPLRKDDRLLGQIVAGRQEVRLFSEKEIALLENFAAQAVIAMENARLITETREALEQQTATAEVLQVINASPGDLTPVFDTILDKAHALCGVAHGALMLFDGANFVAAVTRGVSETFADHLQQGFGGADNPVTRPLLDGARFVHIPDLAQINHPIPQAAANSAGMRTALFVPLRKDNALLGMISSARPDVRPFTEKEIALVENFAAQAVIAMENARLLGELRERTNDLARSVEELKALSEVGQAVSSTLDLHSVLVTILNRSITLAGSDAGVIFRYSRAERAFRFVEAVGWDEALVEQVRDLNVGESVTALGDAIANRAPFQIPDLRLRSPNPLRDSALAAGFRSVLIVPLVGADRIMGATILQRRVVGEFPEATIRLMQALASQSVLAIQNARLFREIADKSEQLAQASQHKSQFLANMSHELRTPLNAILGYTELMADGIYGELAPRAAGVLERVQNNGRHLLALINDVLDLAKIEAGQLTMQLEDYAMPDVVRSVVSATEGLANTKGLKFTADIAPGLPPGRGDARRLSQVLLNLVGNAVKFTDAGEVAVGAWAENGSFVLTVRDTGPGIAAADQAKIFEEFQQVDNSNTRKKGGTGLGLAISKRMVEMQGGTISVESELGHGATFRVVLPVRVEEVAEELLGAAQ